MTWRVYTRKLRGSYVIVKLFLVTASCKSIKRWRYFRILLTFCFCHCLSNNTGRQRSSASASRTQSEELTSYKYQQRTGQSIFWSRLWRSSAHDEMIYFGYLMRFSIGQCPQLIFSSYFLNNSVFIKKKWNVYFSTWFYLNIQINNLRLKKYLTEFIVKTLRKHY